MPPHVTSSRLIGRERELAELNQARSSAASGRPTFSFVAGESGHGKSRLLNELGVDAAADGWRVLRGQCIALGDGELSYAPLVGVLRRLVRDEDPALQALSGSARCELARLVPALGDPPDEEAESASQGRLFEALISLLVAIAADAPLLLIIEDIHWADRSTRAFLPILLSAIAGERMLVALSYRSEELHGRHPLRPVLAELERNPAATRVDLAPLSRDDLREQLADILGTPPEPALVERLFKRTGGNPLFAEELIASAGDGAGPTPPTLRDALLLRVERLPECARAVLRVLACAPRAAEETLALTSGLEPTALREGLREAMESRIVEVDDEGFYLVRHALLREVLEADLLPGERTELHRKLAAALEQLEDDVAKSPFVPAAIAHHYLAAGDQPAALAACLRAARTAERVHAHGDSADLLERALELWGRVPDAERLAGMDHAALLTWTGVEHRNDGAGQRALDLLTAAGDELRDAGDPRRLAVVFEQLSRAHFSLGQTPEALNLVLEGLSLLPAGEHSAERAALLARQSRQLMLQAYYDDAMASAEEAAAIARTVGDNESLSSALNSRGTSLMALGREEEGEASLREAMDVSGFHPRDLGSIYTNLADSLHQAGRSDEALKIVREGIELIHEATIPVWWLALMGVELLSDMGDNAAAHQLMDEHDGPASGTLRVNLDLRKARLALADDEGGRALDLLDEAHRLGDRSYQPQFYAPLGCLRAEAMMRCGDLDAAAEAIDDILAHVVYDRWRMPGVGAQAAAVYAHLAQRYRDIGRDDEEREAIHRAESFAAQAAEAARPGRRVERAHTLFAAAEAQRAAGPDRGAEAHLEAAAAYEAIGRRSAAATARLRAAEALVAAGERERATDALRAVLAIAEPAQERWIEREARSLAARARLTVDETTAAPPDDDVSEDEPDDPFGLTPRERQVLALVAAGATNREIGRVLFMAEKTASVHVSRILAKLDVRSRTEAAAVAHRMGLDHEPTPGAA